MVGIDPNSMRRTKQTDFICSRRLRSGDFLDSSWKQGMGRTSVAEALCAALAARRKPDWNTIRLRTAFDAIACAPQEIARCAVSEQTATLPGDHALIARPGSGRIESAIAPAAQLRKAHRRATRPRRGAISSSRTEGAGAAIKPSTAWWTLHRTLARACQAGGERATNGSEGFSRRYQVLIPKPSPRLYGTAGSPDKLKPRIMASG